MFRECGYLLYGKMLLLRLKWAVYMSYVRPVMLFGSKVWSLKLSVLGVLWRVERCMVRAMCRVLVKDRKRAKYLMLMLSVNERIDLLDMASNVCW